MLIQDYDLVFSHRKAELLVAHAQALAGNLLDDARGAGKCRVRLDQASENAFPCIFVLQLVAVNLLEDLGDFRFDAFFLEPAANRVERAAAAFGEGDGGPFEIFIFAPDLF